MTAPKLKCGNVVLYKSAMMPKEHPCIIILTNSEWNNYIIVNTSSNLSKYPCVNSYIQKGNACCINQHDIFLFCENHFKYNSIVLLGRIFIEKDFGSDIEQAPHLFDLDNNKYRCLLNCLLKSPNVKGYFKDLINKQLSK